MQQSFTKTEKAPPISGLIARLP